MPYLRKGELLPIKGADFSIPSVYLQGGFAFPVNMLYERGQLRKRFGKNKLGQPSIANQKILHLNTFTLSSGIVRLMMHTKTNAYKYNTSTDVFDDVTGINDLSGGDTDFYDSCTIPELDEYIFTQYINNVRKVTDATTSSDLGGNPQKAKYCEYMTPYLLLANLNEGGLAIPTKLKWSDAGNPEVWTGNNAGSHLFTKDATPIMRVKKLGDYVFVYKGGMSERGFLVSTSDIFDFVTHDTSKGMYASRSLIDANNNHYYMGNDDFHANNGVKIDDIGAPVREFVFNRLNRTLFNTCFAMHVEPFKEIWFFITVTNGTYPTEIWKYKYDLNFWYSDTCSNLITGASFKKINTVAWRDLIGTWLQQNWRWSDQSGQADSPLQCFGNDKGLVLSMDQSKFTDYADTYTGRFESRDYSGVGDRGQAGAEDDQEWLQCDIWASGTTLDAYYSTDEGTTWKFIKTLSLTPSIKKHEIYFDVSARQIRFKFENLDPAGYFTFRSLIPYYVYAGEIERSPSDAAA